MPHTISEITPKVLATRVGRNLRRLRDRQGLTREAISKQCRCHPDTIAHYEMGTRQAFEGLVILLRAAEALGCRLDDLLED
jgi:transcriptional regulator with XRE-family HTH domain